jgi:hypothetical protein
VQSIIALAARETVNDRFSGPCTRNAAAAINYRAACLIELSYFPEQARSDRSPYDELKALLDEARTSLLSCIAGAGGGGSPSGEGYSYHSLPIVPASLASWYDRNGWGWRHPEFPSTWQQSHFAPTPETPAYVDEFEPAPMPLFAFTIGHPAEGDPARGMPPIITHPAPS